MGEGFYRHDKLVKGEMEFRGHKVDLSNIRCALLNVSGKWDYMVPIARSKAPVALILSPDKEFASLYARHMGVMVGRVARESFQTGAGEGFAPRPDQ